MTNSRSMVRAVLGALTIILCSLVVPPVAQAVQIRRDRPPTGLPPRRLPLGRPRLTWE